MRTSPSPPFFVSEAEAPLHAAAVQPARELRLDGGGAVGVREICEKVAVALAVASREPAAAAIVEHLSGTRRSVLRF